MVFNKEADYGRVEIFYELFRNHLQRDLLTTHDPCERYPCCIKEADV